MEAEIRDILTRAVKAKEPREEGLGTLIARHFAGKGIGIGFDIPEWRGETARPALSQVIILDINAVSEEMPNSRRAEMCRVSQALGMKAAAPVGLCCRHMPVRRAGCATLEPASGQPSFAPAPHRASLLSH